MLDSEQSETSVRAVFNLAWPVMVSMLSYTLMSVVDTLFVSRLGTDPLAAVGLAAVVVFFTQSFGAGLMGGVRILVAQATGANQPELAARFGWQGLWIALPLGVLMASLSLLPPSMFSLLGATHPVAELSDQFFSIRVLGAPLVLTNLAMSAWFQGRGDTKTPMHATLVGNGINILLDPLLIFGLYGFPRLGVAGAATATVIAMLVQVIYLASRIRPLIAHAPAHADRRLLHPLWVTGAPVGVRYVLEMGSFVVFSSMITFVGPVELAAHIIVVRICSISFLPGHAVGEAAGVLVGQFVGAGRHALARPVILSATKLAVGIMVSWGFIFWLFPAHLVAPFNAESAVADVAIRVLLVAAAFQLFDAVVMAVAGGLNGAGDTRWVMVVSLLCAWLIKVPFAYLFAFNAGLGAQGAWLGFTVELVILSALLVWRASGDRWLHHAVLPPAG
jgi:MATE family multidrug resistance protein